MLDWNSAAEQGKLDLIKQLHENNIKECTKSVMDIAAQHGHLEVVKWLHLNRTEGCTTDAIDHAAENGHLEVVKFLSENRNEGFNWALAFAVKKGYSDIEKYLCFNIHKKRDYIDWIF